MQTINYELITSKMFHNIMLEILSCKSVVRTSYNDFDQVSGLEDGQLSWKPPIEISGDEKV